MHNQQQLKNWCYNPSFGLATKARACKGVGKKWSPGITFHAPGSVGECEGMNPTLPSELPLWELESRWTLESSKGNYKGQNSLNWKVHYIIEKLLELRCLKWARMTHLSTWNTSYGQKKGRCSNYQFDSQTLKVGNCPDLLVCKWHATYHWKALNKGYNYFFKFISIKGLQKKLRASKVAKVLILEILGLQLGNPGTKWHLGVGPMDKHKE
jgi:hypothetical protein